MIPYHDYEGAEYEYPPHEEIELKPCPFCGGEARTWEDFDGWRLYCTKCDATFRGGTEEELIEVWNRRMGEVAK